MLKTTILLLNYSQFIFWFNWAIIIICYLSSSSFFLFLCFSLGLSIYFLYGVCFGPGPRDDEDSPLLGKATSDLGHDNEMMAIPTIQVVPATPAPSVANTPHTTLKPKHAPETRRLSREVVISPLVAAELAEKKRLQDEELAEKSASAIGSMVATNTEDGSGSDGEGGDSGGSKVAKAAAATGAAVVTGGALVAAAAANDKKKDEEGKSNELGDKEKKEDIIGSNTQGEKAPSSDEILGNNFRGDATDKVVLAGAVASTIGDTTSGSTKQIEQQKEDEKNTSVSTTLNEPTVGDQNDALNTSSSAPVLPSVDNKKSTGVVLSAIPKSFSTDDLDSFRNPNATPGISSSVPVTPATRRANALKPLKRMSSFEFIPPSSPDSPGAQRFNNFVVIPVQEPSITQHDDDSGNSEPEDEEKQAYDNVMIDLHKKLNAISADEPSDNSNSNKEVGTKGLSNGLPGSDGSNAVSSGDASITVPQAVIVSQTREFQSVIKKDTLELTPIRERGESKLVAGEEPVPQTNRSLTK